MKTHLWERGLSNSALQPVGCFLFPLGLLGVSTTELIAEEHWKLWKADGTVWRSTKAVVIEYLVSKGISGSFRVNNWRRFERKQWKQLKVLVAKKPLKAQKAVAVKRSLKKVEEPVAPKRLLLAEPGYWKSSKALHSWVENGKGSEQLIWRSSNVTRGNMECVHIQINQIFPFYLCFQALSAGGINRQRVLLKWSGSKLPGFSRPGQCWNMPVSPSWTVK